MKTSLSDMMTASSVEARSTMKKKMIGGVHFTNSWRIYAFISLLFFVRKGQQVLFRHIHMLLNIVKK
jgi:hypothetical protein